MTRLLSAGLTDGGTAGLIWGFLGVSFGFSLVYASIAEMASMFVRTRSEIDDANVYRAPTAGGQYHWVSEFAPRRGQKFLSYITGKFYLSVQAPFTYTSQDGYLPWDGNALLYQSPTSLEPSFKD